MNRLVPLAALLAGACGSATDDRPPTLEYITETILAPTCALAECHSAFKRQVGDQFDTVEATRETIVVNGLAYPFEKADPTQSFLIQTLTVGVDSILDPGSGNVRMPFVSPMPDADIELIKAWIRDGVPGAQCLPNAQGRGCQLVPIPGTRDFHTDVVECVDGNIGAVIQSCTDLVQVCDSGSDTGNGRCTP